MQQTVVVLIPPSSAILSEFNSEKLCKCWSTSNKVLPLGTRGPVIMTHRVVCVCDVTPVNLLLSLLSFVQH